jgi:hypothetical protein
MHITYSNNATWGQGFGGGLEDLLSITGCAKEKSHVTGQVGYLL